MKMKVIGPTGVGSPLAPPLDPLMSILKPKQSFGIHHYPHDPYIIHVMFKLIAFIFFEHRLYGILDR